MKNAISMEQPDFVKRMARSLGGMHTCCNATAMNTSATLPPRPSDYAARAATLHLHDAALTNVTMHPLRGPATS